MGSAPVLALLLLLLVLLIAAVAPRWVAIISSFAMALVLNFFFLPPRGTLRIASVPDLVVLIVFLAVSLVGSELAAIARRRTAEAVAQRDELARLLAERESGELARRRAELATALLKSMGHDLRTPLTAIEIAAMNLQDPGASEALRREQAAIVREQVARLTRVFDRIITMARIDAGALQPEPEWVYGSDIIEAAVQEVEAALGRHRLEQDADEAAVFVDPRLTSTALARVLENAGRHAPAGSTISVHASATHGQLVLIVEDEGPGIPLDVLPRLFEPFFTVTPAGRPGLGIGLAIARGLLAAQGGSISAENRTGGGARFRLHVGSRTPAAALAS
jgi:two-component system sensor histidine kinase KdpD